VKALSLVLAFLPLIVFSLLTRWLPHRDIGVAALCAAVAALIVMAASRPAWPPKIIVSCSFGLFAVLAILGFILARRDDHWLAVWGGSGVGLVLGLLILLLIPVIPFTEQYARESVPRSQWSSPTFKKVNLVLSAAWGVAIIGIGASRVIAAVIGEHTSSRLPQILLSLLVPVVIIVYMFRFSKSYPERVTGQQPAQVPAGPASGH
jgi:hypothetical protein